METFYENPGTFDKFKGFPDDPLSKRLFNVGLLVNLWPFRRFI